MFKKGHKTPKPFVKGNIPWNKGKHYVPSILLKRGHKSYQGLGKNSSNWKGGISKDKKHYQKTKGREYRDRLKLATIQSLGGKCVRCGFTDPRALQFDHINGCSKQERKAQKGAIAKFVLESFIRGENKFQLLCANCNWIKRFENGEHKGYLQLREKVWT